MHLRFQTIKIHNLQIMAFDGFLPLRGENFRWADLVSGNLKEVKATSPATVVLWSAIVNLSGIDCQPTLEMSRNVRAVADFKDSIARDPAFVEPKVGAGSSLGYLMFLQESPFSGWGRSRLPG
jgi:hypothetical protein